MIPYEKVKVDVPTDTKKPEFLKLNPNGAVPLIVHDGTPVFESAAIAIYLGETFGVEKGLFPAAGPQRGPALAWIVRANVTLLGTVRRYHVAALVSYAVMIGFDIKKHARLEAWHARATARPAWATAMQS